MEYFQNILNINLLKNHILKDPICDWFNINQYNFKKDNPSDYKTIILEESNKYKTKLFEKIIELSQCINITTSYKNNEETYNLIINNYPLIINGSLYNSCDNILVSCPLIIRFDIFKKVFPKVTNFLVYQNDLSYLLIDISYSSIKFKTDLKDIINDGIIPYKKCKLYSFQKTFNNIFNYKPYTIILGKEYQCKNTILPKQEYIGNFEIDDNIKNKYYNSLRWINYLRNNYLNMSIYPYPTHKELYPNMNYKESEWEIEKHKLAFKIKEITLVWNITYGERCNYVKNGIKCWDDNRLINNLKESKKKDIQERMIHMNKTNEILIYPRKSVSYGLKKILKMDGIYFDVESFLTFDQKQDFFNTEINPKYPIIAIIGFIHENKYYYYTIDEYNIESEEKIIKLFSDKLFKISNGKSINVYHWGHAENNYIKYIKDKYPQIELPDINLINILDYFKNEPLIVQGVFKFGLKSIGTSLYKNGLINTTWGENDNGLDAMIKFKKLCLERNKQIPLKRYNEISEIVEYNKIDCQVLFEIIELLRKLYL